MSSLTNADLELARQWFDAVQDLNPTYLSAADYALAKRIYETLGMRVPHSIIDSLKITPDNFENDPMLLLSHDEADALGKRLGWKPRNV